jgi:hypothetical protein
MRNFVEVDLIALFAILNPDSLALQAHVITCG